MSINAALEVSDKTTHIFTNRGWAGAVVLYL